MNNDLFPRGRGPAIVLVASALLLSSATLRAEEGDGAWWSITPYIWLMDTKLDLQWRDAAAVGTEIKFKDVLDNLDAAFQINVEGGKGRWSAFADVIYAKLSDDVGEGAFTLDTKNKQVFVDAGIGFWPGGAGSPFGVYGGLRYTEFDNTYELKLQGNEIRRRRDSSGYYDALLGARYRFDLSERWSILTRGDISFGDSEGSWQLQALAAYTVGKRRMNRIVFGYRYRDAEFEDGDLTSEYSFYGFLAGFNFRF